MSEKKKDLTGQNVHGVEEGVNWRNHISWDETPVKYHLDENGRVAPEPAPEPVAEESAPAKGGEDWVSGSVLQSMANHLRKTKRLQITIDEAKELILNDEETKAVYKNHQKLGKF